MSAPRSDSAPAVSFGDVHSELEPKIRRYLSRLVGTTEAEDLTQEVFLKVSRALPDFRGDSKISTWVYRIATNAAFDTLRSSSAQRRPALFQIAAPPADPSAPVDERVIRREARDCIRRYVDELPPSHRSVLLLSEDEGLTDRQIAEALGITVATVKIRLHRARARLKTAFETGCHIYRDDRNDLACEPRVPPVSSDD